MSELTNLYPLERRKARIAALPRIKFRCGRDWTHASGNIIGVYWGKKLNAEEGELIYQKWIEFRWLFRFDVSVK